MRRSKFNEEQIIAILKEAEAGMKTDDVCRRHGISRQTFYRWRSKYGGLEVSEARRLKKLESFNGRFRDECLDQHWFLGLQDARSTISSWRRDYNQSRPHSSLGGLTPLEFHEKNCGQDPRGDGVALAA